MKFVGLDLAGKPENDTGFCLLRDSSVGTKILHTDGEILDEIERIGPEVIAIDAPFDFPKENEMYRKSDLELKEMGFDPLSPNFPGMKVLVTSVKEILKELRDYEVIETFSRAARKALSANANEDEFDALLCALTARKYWKGKYRDLGGIILPED